MNKNFWKPGDKRPKYVGGAPPKKNPKFEKQGVKLPTQLKLKRKGVDGISDEGPKKKTKSSLTGSTLALKFMQRKKLKEEADKQDHERQKEEAARRNSMQWQLQGNSSSENTKTLKNKQNFITIESVEPDLTTEDLGRRSFGGFNKIVEERYRNALTGNKQSRLTETALKNEISSEEMLARFEKYVGIPRGGDGTGGKKKNNNKQNNNNRKSHHQQQKQRK
mmetsp:Transcript_28446/g.44725  ORF Transcript_28446/g.44725 Transcript_28446/m.44725 type:complete len:221 (+) Transcript_28446:36-698(+)|eukprot:CAMPEP_0194578656 /NCGR_PEP_ID=MMETSP0292-20121207/12988_1 /TAXON_ID=39354 /ORGANISM="Heterosigma akashiwo, Strain CCMP2393" /LENGTH=220 /DNA_ID=CAMNT_0039431357 /DNA_START=37 /DNA_END=699 /DNA_ORIENTATION=-